MSKSDQLRAVTPALRRYAYSLTRDRDRADDLVQDCLERALRKWMLWRPSMPLRAWLFRMMRNIHVSEWRRTKQESANVDIDTMIDEPSVAERQSHSMELAKLVQQILMLPDEQREVLMLIGVEGFSYGEAALILEVPEGTVMSRLSRARSRLRDISGDRERPRLRQIK